MTSVERILIEYSLATVLEESIGISIDVRSFEPPSLEEDRSHHPFSSAHQVSSVERILIQYPLDAVLEEWIRR